MYVKTLKPCLGRAPGEYLDVAEHLAKALVADNLAEVLADDQVSTLDQRIAAALDKGLKEFAAKTSRKGQLATLLGQNGEAGGGG